LTTESHVSHVVTPAYISDRPRPAERDRRPDRESGEIVLIIAGAFLGMMCGLLVPVLSLRIVLLMGFPLVAIAAVYVPYKRRTFYKWFEINRSYSGACAAERRTAAVSWRPVHASRARGRDRAAARHRADQLARGPLRPRRDRRTPARRPPHGHRRDRRSRPGVGLRDSEDQEALVDRFGTLLKHVANGDGFVTRIQMLAAPSRRPGRTRQGRLRTRRRTRPRLAAAVVRPAPVHGVHEQRAAPRLPRRLHALQP